MKRTVFGLVVGLMLALALPALAKGAWQVTLTGGGEEVTYKSNGTRSTNEALSGLAGATRIYDGVWNAKYDGTTRPKGELGPAVEAVWMFAGPGGPDNPVLQILYPLADGGPVAHVPAQTLFDEPLREAWFPVAADLADRLAAVGFEPKFLGSEASAVSSPAADRVPAPIVTIAREANSAPVEAAGSGGSTMLLVGGGLLAILGVVAHRWGIMHRSDERAV